MQSKLGLNSAHEKVQTTDYADGLVTDDMVAGAARAAGARGSDAHSSQANVT